MIITIVNDQHWHQIRAKHIGASEVAGLANLSPYTTAYALYHAKAGNAPAPKVNEHSVSVGSALESAIAELYANDNNLELFKCREYHECDAEPFLGATLDYYFKTHEGQYIAVEIKHVTTWAWRDHGWSPDEDYMPPHIEMQLVAQLLATGWRQGRVVAFCDGETYSFTRMRGEDRVEKMAAEILRLVADMQRRIKERDEPDVLGKSVDLEIMGMAAKVDSSKPVLDMTDNREANNLLHELATWQANESTAKKGVDEAKAKITQLFTRASNDGFVASEMVTSHYRLKRTQSEIAAMTIQRKASVMTRFTVKERTDAQPEALDQTAKSNLMGG